MRCRACGQEVVLAERCPYCGSPTGVVAQPDSGGAPGGGALGGGARGGGTSGGATSRRAPPGPGPGPGSGDETSPAGGSGAAGRAAGQGVGAGRTPSGRGVTGRFVGPIGRYGASRDGWAGVGSFGDGPMPGAWRRVWSWKRPGGGRPQVGSLSVGQWLGRLVRYVFDPRVPTWKKGLILGGLLYLVFPVDLVPDLLPPLGWLDDVAVLWLGLHALTRELLRYGPPPRPGGSNPGRNEQRQG